MKIIYSNVSAVHVFDEAFKLIEMIPFKDVESGIKLREGEWLDEELKLIDKFKHEKLIFLGYKKEKLIKITQDINKLRRIPVAVDWKANYVLAGYELKNSLLSDAIIIQALKSHDDLERIFNTIVMRVRDWYELYYPELSREISDNKEFVFAVLKNKEVKETVGFIEDKSDISAIISLAKLAAGVLDEIVKLENYIEGLMKKCCPNILGVAGAVLGARLISLAGSIENLALMPYSTLQLLGAEKALFRHLRTHKKPPKHGVIITHTLVANAKNKGKASRNLAEKISIAARIDFFKGGDVSKKLMEDLIKKLKNV